MADGLDLGVFSAQESPSSTNKNGTVKEPFLIHAVDGRYLIFETDVLRHLREVHYMCGVLVGTLSQIAQQNVFLGLPLELMIEEAAYLVRHGHAYVVDDRAVHRETIASLTPADMDQYRAERLHDRIQRSITVRQDQAQRKRAALEQRGLTHLLHQTMDQELTGEGSKLAAAETEQVSTHVDTASSSTLCNVQTPPSSSALAPDPSPDPARYDLFQYLHQRKYFLTPGLRFGAQYVAYPGDPLRFHSHYVASGHLYDDAIPLMDLVGGGRLGTGVKKAWLVGGKDDEGEVKCFTLEWAGM